MPSQTEFKCDGIFCVSFTFVRTRTLGRFHAMAGNGWKGSMRMCKRMPLREIRRDEHLQRITFHFVALSLRRMQCKCGQALSLHCRLRALRLPIHSISIRSFAAASKESTHESGHFYRSAVDDDIFLERGVRLLCVYVTIAYVIIESSNGEWMMTMAALKSTNIEKTDHYIACTSSGSIHVSQMETDDDCIESNTCAFIAENSEHAHRNCRADSVCFSRSGTTVYEVGNIAFIYLLKPKVEYKMIHFFGL